MIERIRKKKIKNEKRSTMKHKEVGNIEKNIFVVFVVFLKQSEKERKPMATTTNDSTNMLTS